MAHHLQVWREALHCSKGWPADRAERHILARVLISLEWFGLARPLS